MCRNCITDLCNWFCRSNSSTGSSSQGRIKDLWGPGANLDSESYQVAPPVIRWFCTLLVVRTLWTWLANVLLTAVLRLWRFLILFNLFTCFSQRLCTSLVSPGKRIESAQPAGCQAAKWYEMVCSFRCCLSFS